jgi:predicted nucleotidyltransferase
MMPHSVATTQMVGLHHVVLMPGGVSKFSEMNRPKLPNQEDLVAAAEAIARANPSVRGVLLVGGYTCGEQTEASDIDLLVRVARREDVTQDQVRAIFGSSLSTRGFQTRVVDPMILDDRDLGTRSLFPDTGAHMRFLDAERAVLLWGEDFRSLLVPPTRAELLRRCKAFADELLNDKPAIDEQHVLLVAMAGM